jgi:AcrR family transcriptional regulator
MPGKENLTKDDWLRAAMELLRTRGISGVRVLTLAKELGVSRGSFYWHFEDRDDLLRGMLDWWDREMTDGVIQFANESRDSPQRRLMAVAEDVVRSNRNRYETAIRTWAEGDKRAAKTLKRVVTKRLDYVTSLFREAGFPPADARARGDLLAVYVMSEDSILAHETMETRLRLLRRQVRLLTD